MSEPSHLDQRDPGKADVRDVRAEVDRELEAYPDREGLVLLAPEDRWDEFLRLTGCAGAGDECRYRGAIVRKAAVTAVIAQEGF